MVKAGGGLYSLESPKRRKSDSKIEQQSEEKKRGPALP